MKYYTLLIQQYIDNLEKPDKKSVYEFNEINQAIASFHTSLGSAMKDHEIKEALCVAVTSDGSIFANEHYVAPIKEDVETEINTEK